MSYQSPSHPVQVAPPALDSPHPGRLATALLLAAGPLLYALAAILLPQDANWDLRNYHWYNAYAFLNGRFGFDLLPSQTPFFYNPLIDVPFYLLATHVPPQFAVFCLALVQGLNFPLLWMLAKRALPGESGWAWLALAALGICGGGTLSELGRTFYDNVVSLGILGSLVLTLRLLPNLTMQPPSKRLLHAALVAGIPAGIAMGLKQPTIIYGVGLCAPFLLLRAPFTHRLRVAIVFGGGCLLGICAFSGYWMWHLWRDYGNPFFPYFNQLFKSAFARPLSMRDIQFVPQGIQARLLFGFRIVLNPWITGEVYWQDLRIAIWLALMLALALATALSGIAGALRRFAPPATPQRPATEINIESYLLWTGILSYAVWVPLFAIYRYLAPLEMLAPLLGALALRRLAALQGPRALAIALFAGYGGLVLATAKLHAFNDGSPGWMEACCSYDSPWPALAAIPVIAAIVWLASSLAVPHPDAGRWSWRTLALLVCLASAVSVRPADWGFVPWGKQFVSVQVSPPLPVSGHANDAMILMTGTLPFSDVATAFPPDMPILRIASNFSTPDQRTAMNRLMAARIGAHQAKGGRFLILYNAWEEWEVARDLAAFGLAPPAKDRHNCHIVRHNLFADTLYLCPVEPGTATLHPVTPAAP